VITASATFVPITSALVSIPPGVSVVRENSGLSGLIGPIAIGNCVGDGPAEADGDGVGLGELPVAVGE
jgi:hypothetical protein